MLSLATFRGMLWKATDMSGDRVVRRGDMGKKGEKDLPKIFVIIPKNDHQCNASYKILKFIRPFH